VTTVHLAAGRVHCERWASQCIVGTAHASLGPRLAILLNCHIRSPMNSPTGHAKPMGTTCENIKLGSKDHVNRRNRDGVPDSP
jgi:hypothetical protein